MGNALLAVGALACPVGMGAMMWVMAKGMKKDKAEPSGAEVEDLRDEHRRIGAELDRIDGARQPDRDEAPSGLRP